MPCSRYLALILALLSLPWLHAQDVAWEDVYPNPLTRGKSIAVDTNQDVISVGNGLATSAGHNKFIFISKHTSDGTLVWRDSLECLVTNNYHSATWVDTDSANNIFITGYRFTLSGSTEIPNALKVFKLSPAGDVLNEATITGVFGSGANFNLGRKNESCLDGSGNLYVAAAGNSDSQGIAGLNLIKFNNNLAIQWERVHSFGSVHGLRGLSCHDGYITLIGQTDLNGFVHNAVQWDSIGNETWSTTHSLQPWYTDVLVDAAGNSYILSRVDVSDVYQLQVIKYDNQGTEAFNVSYDTGGDCAPGRMAFTSDGHLLATATNWSTGPGYLQMVKLDASNGAVLADTSITLSQSNNWVYDARPDDNGHISICGRTDNNGGAPSEAFIVECDSNGSVVWDTVYSNNATLPMGLDHDADGNIYLVFDIEFTTVKIGGSGCQQLLVLENLLMDTTITYAAGSMIRLINVTISSPAEVTFDTPEIQYQGINAIHNGAMVTVTGAGCN